MKPAGQFVYKCVPGSSGICFPIPVLVNKSKLKNEMKSEDGHRKRRLVVSAISSALTTHPPSMADAPAESTALLGVETSVAECISNGVIGVSALIGTIAAAVNPVGYAYAHWGYWGDLATMISVLGLGTVVICMLAGVACVAMDRKQKIELIREVSKAKVSSLQHRANLESRSQRRVRHFSFSSASSSYSSDSSDSSVGDYYYYS